MNSVEKVWVWFGIVDIFRDEDMIKIGCYMGIC